MKAGTSHLKAKRFAGQNANVLVKVSISGRSARCGQSMPDDFSNLLEYNWGMVAMIGDAIHD